MPRTAGPVTRVFRPCRVFVPSGDHGLVCDVPSSAPGRARQIPPVHPALARPAPARPAPFLSRFTESRKAPLTLPPHACAMATSSPTGHTELTRPDGSPVRVLVVEDEALLAELLSMALRSERWDVRTAGGAAGRGGGARLPARRRRPGPVAAGRGRPFRAGRAAARNARRAGVVPGLAGGRAGAGRGADGGQRRVRHQAVRGRGGHRGAARVAAALGADRARGRCSPSAT